MTPDRSGFTSRDLGTADGSRDPLLVRAILSLYPPRWRERYGEEFASLLTDLAAMSSWGVRVRLIADAAGGALDARLHPLGGRTMHERIRGPVATAAVAVMAFAVAITGFGKMKEGPAFSSLAHAHAAVAASVDSLRATTVVAVVAVLAGALPLAWTVIRQAVTRRRPDLIRPLVIGPAAVIGWLAVAWITARSFGRPVHSGPNIAAVTVITVAGAAAGATVAWAAVAVIRRADLAPRLLQAEVFPMALLSVCMAVVTGAEISWGLAVRATDGALFHSNNGLIATPLVPSWAGSVIVLAATTAVTATATVRAARQLHTPARIS
jgi:hypothetical protein